ncbi:hypothetical protein LTR74_003149 [Friedmanniomyces endolithicus]|nr:hypothetical protein LTR74_003149 [Friedmanniomyces endolithicus]
MDGSYPRSGDRGHLQAEDGNFMWYLDSLDKGYWYQKDKPPALCQPDIWSLAAAFGRQERQEIPIDDEFACLGGFQVPTLCFGELRTSQRHDLAWVVVPVGRAFLPKATNVELDADHFGLPCPPYLLRSPNHPEIEGIIVEKMIGLISATQDFKGISLDYSTAMVKSGGGLRVLSLDGGGVKGLLAVPVLDALMDRVHRLETPMSPEAPRPCDVFDIICVTSTGGLLAIMLGRLRMDLPTCKKAYCELSKHIFRTSWWPLQWSLVRWSRAASGYGSRFSATPLEGAVIEMLNQHFTHEEKEDLKNKGTPFSKTPLVPADGKATTSCFVCATQDGIAKSKRLRSYHVPDDAGTGLTIVEAARATSAAPLYFPPIVVNGQQYFDGGLESDNPILEAVKEVDQNFSDYPVAAILSIGTGATTPKSPAGNVANFIFYMIGRVTGTERAWQRFKDEYNFYTPVSARFQENTELGAIDLASADQLGRIEELAHKYLEQRDVQEELDQCARRLARVTGSGEGLPRVALGASLRAM